MCVNKECPDHSTCTTQCAENSLMQSVSADIAITSIINEAVSAPGTGKALVLIAVNAETVGVQTYQTGPDDFAYALVGVVDAMGDKFGAAAVQKLLTGLSRNIEIRVAKEAQQ